MRCRACNVILSDREASRKFTNHADIANPEARYIDLCDHCMKDTDLTFVENPFTDDTHYDDDDQQAESTD